MNKPTEPTTLLATLYQIYQDAGLSTDQRRQQLIEVQRHIIALHIHRGGDPVVLAAAMAEQSAHARLAAQTNRTPLVASGTSAVKL